MNIDNYIRLLEREYGFSIDNESDYLMDRIEMDEETYQETMDFNSGLTEKMVIGIYTIYKNNFIFSYSISPTTYFKYHYNDILKYLLFSSFFGINRKCRKIEILKLKYIDYDKPLIVVRKTYWLRIIQRHWKRTYEERRWILDGRRGLHAIKYRELMGKYPIGLNYLPTIHGMLEMYK